jgi:3'-phosphoadenosine 5'-phosphosulfate sulfotransferase (PAPS reductase)/FAD synthetase
MAAVSCASPSLVQLRRAGRIDRGVETNDEIDRLIASGEPVVFAVSGGKDSVAGAWATHQHLRARGYGGVFSLIHADLGDPDPALDVEWSDSIGVCQRLAARIGCELIIAQRRAGGMMKRWQTRWENSKHRYANLLCVKIIQPWSTPAMRFCTSELKSAPMASVLVRRFPGSTIISACGVRREESSNRADAPTTAENPRLTSKKHKTTGVDWNPIAAWSASDVFAFIAAHDLPLHDGYAVWDMSRVSCRFCIFQNEHDRAASASNPAHHPLLRTMGGLEMVSGFSFQSAHWLVDERPNLFDSVAVAAAKERARMRAAAESRIPKHLLYTKGWPTVMPTQEEAELLAEVRQAVAALLGIEIKYADAASIIARYAELMALKATKTPRSAR